MKTITVKSIPDELYERLKQSARENRRSINSEILLCIEKAVQSRKRGDIESLFTRTRQLRSRTESFPLTDDEFNEMKRAGRP